MTTLDIVLSEVKKKLNISELNQYDSISLDIVKSLLKEDNICLLDEYENQVQTPFGLAWYYDNYSIQEKYIPLIESDLNSLLDNSKVSFTIYNNFTYKIRIDKKTNIDQGKQSIIIKACINEEDGKTDINYKLVGPEGWGWNITKQQLKALTESEVIIQENFGKLSFWKRLLKIFKRGK